MGRRWAAASLEVVDLGAHLVMAALATVAAGEMARATTAVESTAVVMAVAAMVAAATVGEVRAAVATEEAVMGVATVAEGMVGVAKEVAEMVGGGEEVEDWAEVVMVVAVWAAVKAAVGMEGVEAVAVEMVEEGRAGVQEVVATVAAGRAVVRAIWEAKLAAGWGEDLGGGGGGAQAVVTVRGCQGEAAVVDSVLGSAVALRAVVAWAGPKVLVDWEMVEEAARAQVAVE